MSERKIALLSYTPKEMRVFYDLTEYQWKKWIELIEEKIGTPVAGKYNPDQVKKMIDHWGEPDQKK
jgi:hypothetical protein